MNFSFQSSSEIEPIIPRTVAPWVWHQHHEASWLTMQKLKYHFSSCFLMCIRYKNCKMTKKYTFLNSGWMVECIYRQFRTVQTAISESLRFKGWDGMVQRYAIIILIHYGGDCSPTLVTWWLVCAVEHLTMAHINYDYMPS